MVAMPKIIVCLLAENGDMTKLELSTIHVIDAHVIRFKGTHYAFNSRRSGRIPTFEQVDFLDADAVEHKVIDG